MDLATLDAAKKLAEKNEKKIAELTEEMLAHGSTPDAFGAVGDGVEDDTEAVKQALLTGVCHLNKTYRVTSRIDVPNDCVLTGNGTLVVDSATFGIVFAGKRTVIENINIVIAPNLLYYAFWLRECTNVTISGVTVNGQGIMPCGRGFDVFRCEECDTVHVSDTSIRDIGMYTDYKVSSDKGNVTGINFRFCKYVEVNNFFAANLHNYDDEGNYYLDDSDALFCSGAGTVFHVTNSTFIEAGKRAIKTACDNILIDNCYIYTSTEDSFTGLGFNHVSDGTGAEYPITSALVNNCTIINHHTSGYTFCMVAAPGNVSVNNCRFSAHHDLWGCSVIDTNGASVTYSNCVFDGDFFAGDSDQVFRDCTIRNIVWPGYGAGKTTFHNTTCKNVDTGAVEAYDSIFDTIHCKDDSELTDCVFNGLATFDNYAMLKHCRSKTTEDVSLRLNGGAYLDGFDAGEESKSIGIGFSGDSETLRFKEVDLNKNLIAKSNVSSQRIKTVPYFVEHFPPAMYSHPGMMVQSMQDMRYYRYNGVSWSVVVPATGGDGPGTLDNSQLDYFVLS